MAYGEFGEGSYQSGLPGDDDGFACGGFLCCFAFGAVGFLYGKLSVG